jgi:hypothetical protein
VLLEKGLKSILLSASMDLCASLKMGSLDADATGTKKSG